MIGKKHFVRISLTDPCLLEMRLVGGIILRVDAQNHPLMVSGWNLVWLQPSTSASHSRPAVCTSRMLEGVIRDWTKFCSSSDSKETMSMHILRQ